MTKTIVTFPVSGDARSEGNQIITDEVVHQFSGWDMEILADKRINPMPPCRYLVRDFMSEGGEILNKDLFCERVAQYLLDSQVSEVLVITTKELINKRVILLTNKLRAQSRTGIIPVVQQLTALKRTAAGVVLPQPLKTSQS